MINQIVIEGTVDTVDKGQFKISEPSATIWVVSEYPAEVGEKLRVIGKLRVNKNFTDIKADYVEAVK